MLSTPAVQSSDLWSEAWDGFELHLLSEGKAYSTRKNVRSVVAIMSRHATAEDLEPCDVTRLWLQRYLLSQDEGRKGAGAPAMHQSLKFFWDWYSEEYGSRSPMTGIPRPKGKSAQVPVLRPEDFKAIWKACTGQDGWETSRNLCIVWMMLESGLRRAELSALNLDDVDYKNRTITVLRGKGGKARAATFGDGTAKAVWTWLRQRGKAQEGFLRPGAGNRLTPSGFNQLMRRMEARAGGAGSPA